MQRLEMKLLALILFVFTINSSASADQTFSMDQITRSLEKEYKTQLNRTPRRVSKPKRQAKARASNRISQQTINSILHGAAPKRAPNVRQQPQQVLHKPIAHRPMVNRPVARTQRPIARPPSAPATPHAEDLFSAATNGDIGRIARLLNQGLNVNIANDQRETALHMATAKGRYQAVIYLINHGANIHARTVNNWLPIHHAARFRRAVIANYLIQRGSSPYARTSDGLSAIDMARATRDQRLLGVFHAK